MPLNARCNTSQCGGIRSDQDEIRSRQVQAVPGGARVSEALSGVTLSVAEAVDAERPGRVEASWPRRSSLELTCVAPCRYDAGPVRSGWSTTVLDELCFRGERFSGAGILFRC